MLEAQEDEVDVHGEHRPHAMQANASFGKETQTFESLCPPGGDFERREGGGERERERDRERESERGSERWRERGAPAVNSA